MDIPELFGCCGGGGIRTHGAVKLTLSKRVQLTAMRHLLFLNDKDAYLFKNTILTSKVLTVFSKLDRILE